MGEFSEWKPDQVEFFFSEETGVLGINGSPKLNSEVKSKSYVVISVTFLNFQAVYVKELMKGVPKMECTMSGYPSFARHFEPPYTRL